MHLLQSMAAMLGGSIGRRMAGGQFEAWTGRNVGDMPTRALWAVLVVVPLIGLAPAWHLAGYALTVFASCVMGYPPGSMRPTTLTHIYGLLFHASLGALLAAGWAAWLGDAWWWPLAIMPGCAAAYWCANRWRFDVPWLGVGGVSRDDPAPGGELLYGAVVGLAIAAAVGG